ncbi:methyltransferase [Streptomyces sp. NBC_01618]|uniref:methyltransferase n=1 Tax=Streptomyces sp. NBC_01618 TaxID=2975900 RepID=UPI00386CFFC2|nr:methyltransferase [Streptomyces sp. NBC_01618]
MPATTGNPQEPFLPLRALQQLKPYHWSAGLVIRGMAELRIADHLAAGPRSAAALACLIDAHAPSLARFLRVCELHELIAPAGEDLWKLTDAGELLRSDVPSLRGFSIAVNAPGMTRPWELVADVVRTGRPATRAAWGMDHWEYYAAHPAEARSYAEACASLSVEAAEALVASYDFTGVRRIVDVGGAPGTVLARLLDEVPDAQGVLIDLDWAVPLAGETFESRRQTRRVELAAGDFLSAVPAGGDLYLLKNILCDLDDDAAARLLTNCAKAAPPDGRLLLLDWEYTEHSSHVHANDVEFMVLTGGRARTQDEYEGLLSAAGFHRCRRLPLVGHERAPIALIESVRA